MHLALLIFSSARRFPPKKKCTGAPHQSHLYFLKEKMRRHLSALMHLCSESWDCAFLPLRTFLIFNSAALLYSRVNFGRNSTWVLRRFRLHLDGANRIYLLIHSLPKFHICIQVRSSKRTNEPIRSGTQNPEYIYSSKHARGTSNFGCMGKWKRVRKKERFFVLIHEKWYAAHTGSKVFLVISRMW